MCLCCSVSSRFLYPWFCVLSMVGKALETLLWLISLPWPNVAFPALELFKARLGRTRIQWKVECSLVEPGLTKMGFKVPSKPRHSRIPLFCAVACARKGSLGSTERKESLEADGGIPGSWWNLVWAGWNTKSFKILSKPSCSRIPWFHGAACGRKGSLEAREGVPGRLGRQESLEARAGQGTHACARVLVRTCAPTAPVNWPRKG